MNSKTSRSESNSKRATLKKLRNVGVGTAAIAAMGSTEWVRPIVSQVILPAHAQTTTATCAGLQVVAIPNKCSSGMPVDIFLSSSDGVALQIVSVPTIQATPETYPQPGFGDWKSTSGGAVPAVITDVDEYVVTTRGQVMIDSICQTPATATPLPASYNQRPLTALDLTIEYICSATGTLETVTVDILPQISGGGA